MSEFPAETSVWECTRAERQPKCCPASTLGRKKGAHIRAARHRARKLLDTKRPETQPKNAFVVIQHFRPSARRRSRAYYYRSNLSASFNTRLPWIVPPVRLWTELTRFIEDNNQKSAALECSRFNKRTHVVHKPAIDILQRSMIPTGCHLLRRGIVVPVVVHVRHDE